MSEVGRSSLHPNPPHVSAALYVDQLTPRQAFSNLCEHALRAGAVPTGELELVRAQDFPAFEMISDLAARLERVRRPQGRSPNAGLENWRTLVGGGEPGVQVLRAGLEASEVGPVTVSFDPAIGAPDDRHPVAILVSGELLSIMSHVHLTARQQARAVAAADFICQAFRSACEAMNPLYGAIAVEHSLPTPTTLRREDARLGSEVFVSDQLRNADPALDADLAGLYVDGFVERWGNGIYCSGWEVFNPERKNVGRPVDVGTRTARRLGRAMQVARYR